MILGLDHTLGHFVSMTTLQRDDSAHLKFAIRELPRHS